MRVTQMSTFSNKEERGAISVSMPVAQGRVRRGKSIQSILNTFDTDDYILAGIIIVLIMEGCEDYVLLAALGYLFIMGFRD